MLRSLFSGVSGMKNNQIRMDVIGNNIANVNTTAFKSGRVRFQDILSQTIKNASSPTADGRGGINPRQVGLGMGIAGIDTIVSSGSLQPTGRPLDCAVDGEGYFLVSDGIRTRYSRDGAFNFDSEFNIVNSDGLRLMGYGRLSGHAITLNDDLSKSDGIDWSTATGATVISDGSQITINGKTLTFHSGAGVDNAATGDYYNIADLDDVVTVISGATLPDGDVTAAVNAGGGLDLTADAASGIVNIGGGYGSFASSSIDRSNLVSLSIPPEHPYKDVRINNFSIESNGVIKGVYEDGTIEELGSIALAKFANPAALAKLGGNNYTVSANSGTAEIGEAGVGGYGDIQQSTLEMSNVDLASEFTDMIITSRAFQANSRTITTSDEMLQELLNLKR